MLFTFQRHSFHIEYQIPIQEKLPHYHQIVSIPLFVSWKDQIEIDAAAFGRETTSVRSAAKIYFATSILKVFNFFKFFG